MRADPILSKAGIIARRGGYDAALRILRDEEDRYNGSFKYYYLFAVICLHAGSYVDSHDYLNYARKIKQKDVNLMLCFAVHYLRRMNTVQAVNYYLDVLETDPKNKIAKKALSVIRNYSSSESLSEWVTTPDKLNKLFPPIPAPLITAKTILKAALVSVIAVIFTIGVLIAVKVLPSPFKPRSQRPTTEFVLSSQERKESVETGGYYRYILTRDQAISHYDKALSLFTSYRDEAAKISLNRILESNASEGLKNRARLLMSNMEVPGFDNFKRMDNPSFTDVRNETAVYKDVHVIWRGMATNIELTDEYTNFDLLVGYDTRTTLEGIIPVKFNIPVSINTERPLEVLGKVTFESSYYDIWLEGIAIHQSGRLE